MGAVWTEISQNMASGYTISVAVSSTEKISKHTFYKVLPNDGHRESKRSELVSVLMLR